MGFSVGSRTNQARFLQIKQHKADTLSLVFRHAFGDFQQGNYAGGIVVGVAGVRRANQHQGKENPDQKIPDQHAGENAAGEQTHRKAAKNTHAQNQQHQRKLPEQKQPKIAGCKEIGNGQPGAGVVVGRHQIVCLLGVSEYQVLTAKASLLHPAFISNGSGICLHRVPKGLLLPLRLPQGKGGQNIHGLFKHGLPPLPAARPASFC